MSNETRTPLSAEHLKNALGAPQEPYTLDNDYKGASDIHVHYGTGTPATITDSETIRGRGELSRWQSYGGDIYGPSYTR